MSSSNSWEDPETGQVYLWQGPLTERTMMTVDGLPGQAMLGSLDNAAQGTLIGRMVESGVQFDDGEPDARVSGFRRG